MIRVDYILSVEGGQKNISNCNLCEENISCVEFSAA